MGEMPRLIDCDVHNELNKLEDLLPFLPKVWHDQWMGSGIGIGKKAWSPVGVLRKDAVPENGGLPASDPHFLLKDLVEKYGIDYAILTGNATMIGLSVTYDPDYANALALAYNDWLVEKWLKVSPKFKGSIMVNHSDPVAAAKEIDRMAGHPDIVQVIMCSASLMLFGQRFYHPIYEAAERNGLPIAIHPGPDGLGKAGAPTPFGYPTRYLEWHTIVPIGYMSHLNSLIFEGVFEKFPKLKIVAIEGGVCWLPHLMWRMDKNYKALRDQVPWLNKLPSEYIKEHIRLTTQPIEEPQNPEHLVQIFNMCGAEDIVMFSSDYPHWDFDNPQMVLSPFPKEMREKIKAKNAIELYGLKNIALPAGTGGRS